MPDARTIVETAAITSVITAVASTSIVTYLLGPRLEARNRRLQARHRARDDFGDAILAILGACTLLLHLEIPPRGSAQVRDALREERRRWRGQLDQATATVVDTWQRFTFTYADAMGVRENVARYVMAVRMVYLSERPEEKKLRLLLELSGDFYDVHFGGLRRLILHPKRQYAAHRGMVATFRELDLIQ